MAEPTGTVTVKVKAEFDDTVLFGNPDATNPHRLIEAFVRGEVTEGGMAEAGWFVVGKFAQEDQ